MISPWHVLSKLNELTRLTVYCFTDTTDAKLLANSSLSLTIPPHWNFGGGRSKVCWSSIVSTCWKLDVLSSLRRCVSLFEPPSLQHVQHHEHNPAHIERSRLDYVTRAPTNQTPPSKSIAFLFVVWEYFYYNYTFSATLCFTQCQKQSL